MKIEGIHHAQVCVPLGSEDTARDFYCGVLGLKEIDKPESLRSRGGFWVEVGDRQLHIGTEGVVERAVSKAHIAYQVDDIAEWKLHLVSSGVQVLEGIGIPGFERIEIRDPFGNRIELIQPE